MHRPHYNEINKKRPPDEQITCTSTSMHVLRPSHRAHAGTNKAPCHLNQSQHTVRCYTGGVTQRPRLMKAIYQRAWGRVLRWEFLSGVLE